MASLNDKLHEFCLILDSNATDGKEADVDIPVLAQPKVRPVIDLLFRYNGFR